jgi:hypothetical protein
MRKFTALILALSFLAFPVTVLAADDIPEAETPASQTESGASVEAISAATSEASVDVCEQAAADAERDVRCDVWRNAGCLTACILSPLFGLGVVGLAYLVKPEVPVTDLLGKSAEYTDTYVICYKEQAQKIQTDEAMAGCIAGSLASLAFWGVATAVFILTMYIVY